MSYSNNTQTLLALDRYAEIMGISPPHFNMGVGTTYFPVVGSCSDVWPQWMWQKNDAASIEHLADKIDEAELEIAEVLGYFPAPKYLEQDIYTWPRFYRPEFEAGDFDIKFRNMGITLRWGKIISPGVRASTLIGTAELGVELSYVDVDGDGYAEIARIEIATTITDEKEIKIFFADESADERYEIRPLKSIEISGGIATIEFYAWLVLKPSLRQVFPTQVGFSAIDIEDSDNYVDELEVYRVYTDTTQASSTFIWENVVDECVTTPCSLTSQDGCLKIRDAEMGIVVPITATYSSGSWSLDSWIKCNDPSQVKLKYLSGATSERWRRGLTVDPMPDKLARAIAYLATARLERVPCSCGNTKARFEALMLDVSKSATESYNKTFKQLDNPFGTRQGEIRAWQIINSLTDKRSEGGAV